MVQKADSGRGVTLPSLVGQAIALQGPGTDASQKRLSARGAAVSLTPSLAKIADKDVVVELRGLPLAPPFKVGGRSGNAVTSSQSSKIHRGWRIVAVCGQRVPAEGVAAALSAAQKTAKYTVTFRLSTEEEVSREDSKEEQRREQERSERLRKEEQERLREEEAQQEEEQLLREKEELQREKESKASKAREAARQAAEKSLGKSAGLPPRLEVEEPQKALLAALAPPAAKPAPVVQPNGPCDKCDGPHASDDCPHFKKPRDDHKDAYENFQKGGSTQEASQPETLPKSSVRVLPQPGDGSCLFHSLSHGLEGRGASALRAEIADYIAEHPHQEVAGNPISDWVLWDSGEDPKAYALSMREGSRWGGAMEIALCAKLHNVSVEIFERRSDHFARIASFGDAAKAGPVRLLYGGRVHYDALELC